MSDDTNDTSLVDKLPNELLVSIFLGVVESSSQRSQDSYADERYRCLLNLMLICKRFHDIIRGAAELWCFASLNFHPQLLSHIIERSQNRLLDVEFGPSLIYLGQGYPPPVDQEQAMFQNIDNLLKYIGPEFHRCASLDISFLWLPVEHVQAWLTKPAPQLRSLNVGWRAPEGAPPIDLFSKQAEHLREITIVSFAAVWNSPIFADLEVLVLNDITNGPSVQELLHMLERCPRLHTLAMECVAIKGGRRPLGRTLALACLKKLVIITHNNSFGEWYSVLYHIDSIPLCEKLALDLDDWVESPSILTSLSAVQKDLVRVFVTAPQFLMTWDNSYTLELRAGPSKIKVLGEGHSCGKRLTGLRPFRCFHMLPISPFASEWHSTSPLTSKPLPLWQTTESMKSSYTVNSLSTSPVTSPCYRLCRGEATPGTWRASFRFPDMNLLRIDVYAAHVGALLEALMEALERRWTAVQKPDPEVRMFRVSFAATCADAGGMRRIAAIIGPENVTHYDGGSDRKIADEVKTTFREEEHDALLCQPVLGRFLRAVGHD